MFFIIISLMYGCCKKKDHHEISGIVYSKHGYRVNNARVITEGHVKNGGNRTIYVNLLTDSKGEFSKVECTKKTTYYLQIVESDSGGVVFETYNINDLKNHDIHL